jgi:hypothetical protein
MTLLIALSLAACGSSAPAATDPSSVAERPATAEVEMAPTPYTADQIRDATRPGRTYRFRDETDGEPVRIREIVFQTADAGGADIATRMLDESGTEISSEPASHATWEELRRHAQFPATAVHMHDEAITVPAGTFACVVYTVTDEAEGTVTTFYFARDLPGAPVLFYQDAGGRRVSTTTLVAHTPGSAHAPE